jgi:hypothetical protein
VNTRFLSLELDEAVACASERLTPVLVLNIEKWLPASITVGLQKLMANEVMVRWLLTDPVMLV